MITHIKVIAILHIVLGALGVLAGLALLVFFGGLAGLAGADRSHDSLAAVPLLGGIGALIFIVLLMLSLPGILAGIGLLQFKSWARTLTIIMSVIHLLNIPFGTALGVYGLWALLSREGEALFRRADPLAPMQTY